MIIPSWSRPEVIVLRDISREEAKEEIRQLFARREVADYEDIVTELRIPLELAVEICEELIQDGEIRGG